MNRTIGKFNLPCIIGESDEVLDYFNLLNFVPLRVTYDHLMSRYEYIGTSYFFRTVEEGERIPEYIIKVEVHRDLTKSVQIEEVKDE